MTVARFDRSAHELNVFADALRECLGLHPIHQDRVNVKQHRDTELRFYAVPFEWQDERKPPRHHD